MRVFTWVSGSLVLVSVLGMLVGLAEYSFPTFLFGGGPAEIAQTRTQGIAIIGSSAVLLVPATVLILARRL